jgi:chloramphenicol-sensitive protein RarD
MTKDHSAPGEQTRSMTLAAISALCGCVIWGVSPFYFKAISEVPASQILAHRIVWSALFVVALLFVLGRWPLVSDSLANRKRLAVMVLSAFLLACNWLVFIWGVNHDRVLETSLGYFIYPLVNVVLGFFFLGERLGRWQWAAVALAGVAVIILLSGYGRMPWVAFALASVFGVYGLLRKVAKVDSLTGLSVELLVLCPFALAYLIFLEYSGDGLFAHQGRALDGLLAGSALMTAVPLLLFIHGARRLRLSTIGFFHYIAPIGHFLLAVFVYAEPFTATHMVTFGFIWLALVLYAKER